MIPLQMAVLHTKPDPQDPTAAGTLLRGTVPAPLPAWSLMGRFWAVEVKSGRYEVAQVPRKLSVE